MGHACEPGPICRTRSGTAELLKAYLASVGVKTRIFSIDWEAYLKKTSNGKYDMCLRGWLGGNADPDSFLYGLLSADTAKTPGASNASLWKNAEFTRLCKQAQVIFNKQARAEKYMKAQEIFHAENPWIPLAHTTIVRCYNKRLKNVPLRAQRAEQFSDGD